MPIPSLKPNGTVTENLLIIKSADGRASLSSKEEAQAIMDYIPNAVIRCKYDREVLTWARRDAETYLKYGDTSLLAESIRLAKYLKKQGSKFATKITKQINRAKEKFASL